MKNLNYQKAGKGEEHKADAMLKIISQYCEKKMHSNVTSMLNKINNFTVKTGSDLKCNNWKEKSTFVTCVLSHEKSFL